MSVNGLIASGGLLLLVLLVAFFPLVWKRSAGNRTALTDRERERALAYYERVLTNVRDLDEDHATGKIAPAEYEAERSMWVGRGVKLLKLLDELDTQHHLVDEQADDAAIDAAIDAALQQEPEPAIAEPQRTHEVS